jgi:hypothetical protein
MQDSQGSQRQQAAKVKCQECGFLAWRSKKTRELVEVEPEYRTFPDMNTNGRYQYFDSIPACFVAALDIGKEFPPSTPISVKATTEVISKPRECGEYTRVRHGLSPKEHLQMWMLEEQRKRDDARDEAMRKREDDRDEAQRQWQARQESKLAGWAAAYTILAAIVTVVGAPMAARMSQDSNQTGSQPAAAAQGSTSAADARLPAKDSPFKSPSTSANPPHPPAKPAE